MRADEHSPGHTAAPPAAGSIHHPTRTCPRLILLSYLRGNKNDAFQHMYPTSIFLCCRKDSSIQCVPQVTAPAHTQPSPATGCGRAPALSGLGPPLRPRTRQDPSDTLWRQQPAQKECHCLSLTNRPDSSPSLGNSAEPSHSTRIAAGQPPLPKNKPGSVLGSGKQPLLQGRASHRTTKLSGHC